MTRKISWMMDIRSGTRRALYLLIAGFVIQIYSLIILWSHTSDIPDFLNRYSKGYALVVIFSVVWAFLWGVGLVAHRRIESFANRIPSPWYITSMVISGLVVFAQWLPSIETSIKIYVAMNWLVVVVIWSLLRSDRPVVSRKWQLVVALVCLLLLVPMLITAMSDHRFRPDDGQWADYASSAFQAGGVYSRTWLQEPVAILPGLGWSVAAYGWALENIAFDVHVGRVWNFAFYMLAFGGIGALTWRLYGRDAALVSTGFAVLSSAFIPSFDYRPDHQLPFAAALIFFIAIQARLSSRRASWWHFACGLLATLSLQLHAAAVVFAAGFSLYYLVEALLNYYRQRKISVFWPLLWFGLGTLIGTVIYYVLNIQSVGGLDAFLKFLFARPSLPNRFQFLRWSSLLELLVIAPALAYLIYRRTASDRLFLGMLASVLLGIVFLDTQGYRTHYSALYIVSVGVLLVDGLNSFKPSQSMRSIVISLSIFAVLAGQASGIFVQWSVVGNWLNTGSLPPFLYQELRPILAPLVSEDDVIVSTHQLIGTLPDHPNLVSFAAEQTAMERWHLSDPKAVWERVNPTVIIEVENEMHFDPGLQAYMEEKGFQICETFAVLDRAIHLYRASCP